MMPYRFELWEKTPSGGDYVPYVLHYKPKVQLMEGAVLLVPGSGYRHNPDIPKQEGERVAEILCERGINVFVLIYRVRAGGCYPYPILDGRRAMRLIRYRADEFNVDPKKIVTLGYSAGGHLCASLVSFHEKLVGEGEDEIDNVSYVPNFQALCYPVISFDVSNGFTHVDSVASLLGDAHKELVPLMCFENNAAASVPPTFIFHNFDDTCVSVQNSLAYASRLKEIGTDVEMHIYPHGDHGVGYATDGKPSSMHNREWLSAFIGWLEYNGLLEKK